MHKGDIFEPNIYNKILVPAAHYNNKEDKRLLIPFTNGRNIGFMRRDNVAVTNTEYSAYYGDCYSEKDYIRVEKPYTEWHSYNRANSVLFLQGVINFKGEVIYPCNYLSILPSLNSEVRLFTLESQKREYAVVDSNKQTIVPYGKYTWIGGYNKGYARVKIGTLPNCVEERDAKWGIIDSSGKEVVPIEYTYIWDFYKSGWDEVGILKDKESYCFNLKEGAIKQYKRKYIPLAEFRKAYKQMIVCRRIDENSGDEYTKECLFVDSRGEVTHVYIARPLRAYSPAKIYEEESNLSVVLLSSDRYCLCRNWEEVKLFE